MSVLRRAYVEVEPDVTGFDEKLREKFAKTDPGGKAGKQLGGQLNRALKRLDLDPVDIKADPKSALASMGEVERKLIALSNNASTVEIKVQAQRGLGEIARFRKQLGDVGDVGDDIAVGFFAKFSGRLGPLMASLPLNGPVGISAAAAGAAAAPVLISALASGIAAGAGAGVLGIGLAALAKDPQVAARGAQVGKRFGDELQRQAANALRGTALNALGQIDAAAVRTADRIGVTMRALAPELDPLIQKVTQAAESLSIDLLGAARNSGPALDGLGDSITLLADGAGDFVSILSDGGPEAAANLRLIAGATADLARWTANTLNLFNKLASNEYLAGPLLNILKAKYAGAADETQNLTTKTSAANTNFVSLSASIKAAGEASQTTTVSISAVTAATDFASKRVKELTGDMNDLFGAQMSVDRANLAVRNGMVSLSAELGKGSRTLALNSAEGRKNRGAVLDQLAAIDSLRQSRIKHGTTLGEASRLYVKDIDGLRKSMVQAGFTKKQIDGLLGSYRKIPGKVVTNLGTTGYKSVSSQLIALAAYQTALKKGNSNVASIRKELSRDNADFLKFDKGGWTGPGGTYDEAGIVHADEFVVKKRARRQLEERHPGLLDHMNATGKLPGYATGGRVAWPYPVNVSGTKIPSKSQVASVVVPDGPAGGMTYKWMQRLLESRFGVNMISGYRPGSRTLSGNVSYHASGRAVDFPAIKAMAAFMYANYKPRLKEAITPWQQYNVHNGRSHRYTGDVWNQHNFAGGNAHNHFAMDDGGLRTLQPGMNFVGNGTGRPELIGGPAAMAAAGGVHVHLHDGVIVTSKRQAEDLVVDAVNSAWRNGRLPVLGGRR